MPRVSVMNSVRTPTSPRAGTRQSIRTHPVPWLTIPSSSPLRVESSVVIVPTCASGDVDGDALHRLVALAVDLLHDDVRLADGELEPLAPHRLDQDGELQLAAAVDLPGVGAVRRAPRGATRCRRAPGRAATSRGARSACVPSRPATGEVLIPIVIDRLGSSTRSGSSGRGSSGSASVSPIVISSMPAIATMSPGPRGLRGDPVERLGDVELGQPHALDRAVEPAPRDVLAALEGARDRRARARCRPT